MAAFTENIRHCTISSPEHWCLQGPQLAIPIPSRHRRRILVIVAAQSASGEERICNDGECREQDNADMTSQVN